jgi:uncharacterized protein (TIGR02452 family)
MRVARHFGNIMLGAGDEMHRKIAVVKRAAKERVMASWQERIRVWELTKALCGMRDPVPKRKSYDPRNWPMTGVFDTDVSVQNVDSVVAGESLLRRGLRPLVLVFADDSFAGGSVQLGSGAQEESIFRRTNLSRALIPSLYPIGPTDAILCTDVTVFRGTEEEGCPFLQNPFRLSFIACPGVRCRNAEMSATEVVALRVKVRLILQVALDAGYDAIVLGALGCGAWRCPPPQVATVFDEELKSCRGAFASVVFACLETSRGTSNFDVFSRVFAA